MIKINKNRQRVKTMKESRWFGLGLVLLLIVCLALLLEGVQKRPNNFSPQAHGAAVTPTPHKDTVETQIAVESPLTPRTYRSPTPVSCQVQVGCIQAQKVDAFGQPLQGWNITLEREDGTWPGASQLTDGAGYALFDGLALGAWVVRGEAKDWWRSTSPAAYRIELTLPGPLTPPDQCVDVIFRSEALGCIEGYKTNHLEQGLPGWTIRVRNQASAQEYTTITDEWGYFQFRDLPLGTWRVSEVAQDGWYPLSPSEFEIEVTRPFVCQHVRFKNKTDLACLDVFKKDTRGGSGLAGWKITVQATRGGAPVDGVTDGSGHVRFNGLRPGAYNVWENVLEDWVLVPPTSQQITLQASGSCATVTFQNRPTTASPHTGETAMPSAGKTALLDSHQAVAPDASEAAPHDNTCQAIHPVQRDDTLYSLSKKYGVTIAAIKSANGLNSNKILVGQSLCIP
jgi:LysM repeat protein